MIYTNEYYIAFKIEDGDTPQLAWLKLRGNKFLRYGFQEVTSGIKDNDHSSYFMVYPNPAQDYILFNLNEETNNEYHVEIFNSWGQKVEEYDIYDSGTMKIVSHLERGLYIIRMNLDGKYFTEKIILE